MSTTTLSQRLRDLRHGIFPDIETVNAVLDDCIAQAEAQEAQAGELSDEEVGRAAMDSIPADSHVGLALDQDGAIDMARAFFERGLRYARDHYLKPSQAIGEQKPVAWTERWIPPPGETHHPHSMTKWRLVEPKYAGQTLDGRIEELRSYNFTGRAQHEVIPLYRSPITPEARDRAIEKVDQAISALRGQTSGT